jgi:hypothetical protein
MPSLEAVYPVGNGLRATLARPASITSPRRGCLRPFGHYCRSSRRRSFRSARTPMSDENNDHYPVPLTRRRCAWDRVRRSDGTFCARGAVAVGRAAGLLPSTGSLTGRSRKRLARQYLFGRSRAWGPRFKRFRPIVHEKNGGLRRLANAEIAGIRSMSDFRRAGEARYRRLYDRMDDDVAGAARSFARQRRRRSRRSKSVKTRVTSVENGASSRAAGAAMDMPDGPSFETTGVGRFRNAVARFASVDRD